MFAIWFPLFLSFITLYTKIIYNLSQNIERNMTKYLWPRFVLKIYHNSDIRIVGILLEID